MPAKRSRASRAGIRRATCATTSKPFASPRREEIVMSRRFFLALLLASAAIAGSSFASSRAAPVSYKLPDETAAFKPGPNLDVVKNNCTGCHSADYINTQPRHAKSAKDFWQAEVTKVYGAPIDGTDVPKIVEYLAATY